MSYHRRKTISEDQRRRNQSYDRWNRRLIGQIQAMKRDIEQTKKQQAEQIRKVGSDAIQVPEGNQEGYRGEQIQQPVVAPPD